MTQEQEGKPQIRDIASKPKLDKRNYMFVNQSGQELIKKPGDINGQVFKLDKLTNCTVWLLDSIAQVSFMVNTLALC